MFMRTISPFIGDKQSFEVSGTTVYVCDWQLLKKIRVKLV